MSIIIVINVVHDYVGWIIERLRVRNKCGEKCGYLLTKNTVGIVDVVIEQGNHHPGCGAMGYHRPILVQKDRVAW